VFTTIAFVATAIFTFVVGFAAGVYYTARVIAEGKVENVKVVA
jgi:hypothetical protein